MGEIKTKLQVLDRAFNIIDILAPEISLSAAEISGRSGLNKSTTYRFLEALAQHGYVEKTHDGKYRLGLKIVTVAGYYINKLELITIAQPCLWDLAAKLNLSVFIAIQDGTDIIYIARADVYKLRQIYTDIGMRVPALQTAMGKCLLADLTAEMQNVLISKTIEERKLGSTDIEYYKEMLRDVRRKGYALDDQEFMENLRCIGAPVYDYCGETVAAICASGTCTQISEDRYDEISKIVIRAANDISQKLGYKL